LSARLLIRVSTAISDGASIPADVLVSDGSIVAVAVRWVSRPETRHDGLDY
jgi:hypothetical protein